MNFNYNSAQLAPLHNRKLVEFILPYLSFVQHDRSPCNSSSPTKQIQNGENSRIDALNFDSFFIPKRRYHLRLIDYLHHKSAYAEMAKLHNSWGTSNQECVWSVSFVFKWKWKRRHYQIVIVSRTVFAFFCVWVICWGPPASRRSHSRMIRPPMDGFYKFGMIFSIYHIWHSNNKKRI